MSGASPAPARRLRVAHVVRSDAFAGVERYITYVAPELQRRGFDVTVIGGAPDRMRDALSSSELPVLPAATTAAVATSLARCGRVDVVHAHMSAAELAAVVVGLVRRVPVVATRHFAAPRGATLPGRMAAVLIGRRVAREIAISRFVADAVGGDCVVIPNGVPRAPASRSRRQTVLMAQRLEQEKDVDVGIRAWAACRIRHAGWRLVVAGTGAREATVRALARDLGTQDSIEFVGAPPTLTPLFDEAAIFLATARAEPFGLSVVEAMASALPVVASASGAHLETVGSCSSRWLFPPGDHTTCARLLDELGFDEAGRAEYGAALQQAQRRSFDLDAHVDRLVDVYLDVAGQPGGSVRHAAPA